MGAPAPLPLLLKKPDRVSVTDDDSSEEVVRDISTEQPLQLVVPQLAWLAQVST
jgi:hypothetical protein